MFWKEEVVRAVFWIELAALVEALGRILRSLEIREERSLSLNPVSLGAPACRVQPE